ncbi:MAG: spermidine/putrescine transporter substrate-binding protein [Rariglobus sp.]|jgi:spermidine/putrescine transport system substrate-binding protein|nr:spermidine/putrescine transporter substrate-binding protein [Rariglobus sp.]
MKPIRLLPLLAIAAVFATAARAADKELNLYAWSEYIPQTVLDGFTKETGIKVNYETFSSGEEMLAKLLAGGTRYDLIQPPDYVAEALIKNKLLVPLDYKKLPNFKNLLPEFTKMPHDPAQKFTVPYMAGTVGIVVNTEKIKEPVAGYKDLFSARYKDRIVVLDDGRELVVGAFYTQGIGLNDITPATLEKARPILTAWFKNIKLFDSDSPKTALLNGDVDLGLVWSGEAAILWNENKKFHYVLPSEGVHMFVDVLAIPKGSRNQSAAHAFLDYLLRPDVSALISEEFPYTNPNGEARKLLTPEQLANPASYPKTDRKLDTFRHLGTSGALIDELFTDLKNTK